jgi:alkanesulfonate monooxygenase SsuD/methylene tetrahydromethanopterin reductase-like flavin-dependent oxidoreductase (luciferase family)
LILGATTIPDAPWSELLARWRALDVRPEVESISVPDHHFRGWHECWQCLAGAAHVTERVRIGSLVSPATSHDPVQLARAALTLQEMSSGRVDLGVGSGGDAKRFPDWTARVAEELAGRVPLTVGGAGETALRVAAEHAARWNYSPQREDTRDGARRRGRELNDRLDEFATRPIVRSVLVAYPFTAEDATPVDELMSAWADAGFDELVLDYPGAFLKPQT